MRWKIVSDCQREHIVRIEPEMHVSDFGYCKVLRRKMDKICTGSLLIGQILSVLRHLTRSVTPGNSLAGFPGVQDFMLTDFA
jgi:hypothetical protein